MNVAGSPRPASVPKLKREPGTKTATNSADLDFYFNPPQCELTTDQFEEYALARLKVLRKIEELKIRNITGENFRIGLDKTIQANLTLIDETQATLAPGSNRTKTAKAIRIATQKIDHTSHFILRAAYCRTEDLRRWFLTQETALFKHRLESIATHSSPGNNNVGLKNVLRSNNIHFDPVSDDEKTRLKPYLLQIATVDHKLPSMADISNTLYFKIPFQEATDLIAKRQCYVKAGYAYVPLVKIVSILTARFRIALSKSLSQASRVFTTVTGDYAPVAPLLKSINDQYTGKDYDNDSNNIDGEYQLNSQNVDQYAESMPLCMSMLHNGLKQDAKVKHHGRLQYGLFLKGAGMSMEEHLIYFQKEFTRIMTSEKFNKEYSYNVRHMHGKEGKRASYSAYNCSKIILGTPPNSGDHHGCPFRHFDDDHLAATLGKMKIGNANDRNEIMNLKKNRHYNLACQKHFEVMHPKSTSVEGLSLNGVGDHPNAWFAASVGYKVATSTLSGGDVNMIVEDKKTTA